MTRKWIVPVVAFGALAMVPAMASAQSDTHDVAFEVEAINVIALSAVSGPLVISTATPGSAPDAVTAAASYAITTNETGRKITASLDSNMPAGLTLSVAVDAPSVGTSAGQVALAAAAVDVVTGISSLNESAIAMEYELAATAAAVVQSGLRTVTFTIVAGS